jgi:hypothetical protein
LSPAVNDPGTAISVLIAACAVSRFWQAAWHQKTPDSVHGLVIATDDLFTDFFAKICPDGAGIVEVQQRIQAVLALAQPWPDIFFWQPQQKRPAILWRERSIPLSTSRTHKDPKARSQRVSPLLFIRVGRSGAARKGRFRPAQSRHDIRRAVHCLQPEWRPDDTDHIANWFSRAQGCTDGTDQPYFVGAQGFLIRKWRRPSQ